MTDVLLGITQIEYAVLLEGKEIFKSSAKLVAENYKNNLPLDERTKATVVPTAGGKQVLLG